MANCISTCYPAVVIFALSSVLFAANQSRAQNEPGVAAVGVEIGQIGGVAGKLHRPNGVAYDALVTTDADDVFTLFVHRLRNRALPESEVYVFYGGGLFLGGRALDVTPTFAGGLSSRIGLNFYSERFEVFLQMTPILQIRPSLRPFLKGSVGLRYSLFTPD